MFVENYRRENAETLMAGGDAIQLPYPRISEKDWRVWSTFLPVRSHELDHAAAASFIPTRFHDHIPAEVAREVQRASQYFDKVEIWRKERLEKDPIAVGILGQERYLIARWGMEKLIPFDAIKKFIPLVLVWKYATSPFAIMLELAGTSLLVGYFL
jgi:hypothetical protein